MGESATTPFSTVALTDSFPATSLTIDGSERLEQYLQILGGSCEPPRLHAMKVVLGSPPTGLCLTLLCWSKVYVTSSAFQARQAK